MSTTKTIKIQKNKILTYSINKTGFQTVNKTITVTGDTTITEELVSQTGSPILQMGDRLLGISTFFMYFTPSGENDVDSLKFITASQTNGTGLTNIQVSKTLWLAQIETALSVTTPKGTSKDFVFTYNGSSWDLTGGTTQSAISTQDLNDVYGISFTGTATSGHAITVTETHYNKFACYILDSNYRTSNLNWGLEAINMPKQYASNPQNCIESATFFNQYIININTANLNNFPPFNYCKNKGIFILPNGIKINCVLPNGAEIQTIWDNKVLLDSFDPVIQAGGTDYNLTNWAFSQSIGGKAVMCCLQRDSSNAWNFHKDEHWRATNIANSYNKYGVVPIFEVPVM